MKLRTILSTALMTMAIANTAAAEKVKIGIAAEPYPPFASTDSSGKWTGWEIEISEAICASAKLDCELAPTAWDGIIPSLTGKQIDVIMASMSITDERSKTIDFSDKYYDTPAVIVAEKSMKITPDMEGLKGKILGVQASTTHATYAQAHFADGAELKLYQTQDEANQDLVAGRVDAIQADSIAMADFIASNAGKCCEIKGAVKADEAILGKGIGAGVRKGDTELLEKLNTAIAAIIEDGTHKKITEKYFTVDIY